MSNQTKKKSQTKTNRPSLILRPEVMAYLKSLDPAKHVTKPQPIGYPLGTERFDPISPEDPTGYWVPSSSASSPQEQSQQNDSKKLVLRLPQELHKALKLYAIEKGKTVTGVVIEWIVEHLKNDETKEPVI